MEINESIESSSSYLLSLQEPQGYWWFTLEANESIGAEFIFLMHFLDIIEPEIINAIVHRIMDTARPDGTWALYKDGPADLSATIECYFALKLAGKDINSELMLKAREFIANNGGIENCRVFTRIHLALFGILPWEKSPSMPCELILLPKWFPVNIYEFSSWARASIVPLMIIMALKPVRHLKSTYLDELKSIKSSNKKPLILSHVIFIYLDRIIKLYERHSLKFLRKRAIKRSYEWTCRHIQRTEDIYPALAYAGIAFRAIGLPNNSPQIKAVLNALKSFQQHYDTSNLPARPSDRRPTTDDRRIHQQCCISPVWDTPWALMALLEAGVPPDSPPLLKAARWLISKQITNFKGDWAVKNPKGTPGGWSFEFKNDYFPDIDDTIEVVSVLKKVAVSESEKEGAINKAVKWLLSMQNKDGGWGAFDKNQTLKMVNKIPFSDHGACLDPSSPDITGRMIELLFACQMTQNDKPIARALTYLKKNQEGFGGWFGRWGINYIYGTWCVLSGLSELGFSSGIDIKAATHWLTCIQNKDGGFGESPESYAKKTYVRWKESVASQTAWALMALTAGGMADSDPARAAAEFLISHMDAQGSPTRGSWNEEAYTGTGFPGHFYIRYHGYRHYFPLLALARFKRALKID